VTDTNGWSKAELHVMKELERLHHEVAGIRGDMQKLISDVAVASTAFRHHAVAFGLIGGAVASLIGGIALAVIFK
jgi:hypothetical protein